MQPPARPEVQKSISEALQQHTGLSLNFPILTPQGNTKHLHLRGDYLIYNSLGEAVQLFGITQDVTSQKQVEQELKEHKTYLERAFKVSRMGAWSYDFATGNSTWSPELSEVHGFPPESQVFDREKLLNMIHPEDRATLTQVMDAAWDLNNPIEMEFRVKSPPLNHA
ncbi:MAG: PAS domain-containing protein [Bacteroidia bacterium]|nr:PAS domain-containing protein [Bacteroidia bacterium]